MDELAQAVGQDELEFRRKLMSKHPRNLAVLNAVAERIGWGKPAPQGVYRGLAQYEGVQQLCGGGGGNLGHRRQQDQGPPDRRRDRSATMPSTRPRSTGRWRARSSTACPRCSIRSAPSRTAASSRPTSTNYNSMRIAEMPKVESIVIAVPGQPALGRRRRADDLRGRARGAQCVLQGDGPARPLVPVEEPQYRHGLRAIRRAIRAAAARPPLCLWATGIMRSRRARDRHRRTPVLFPAPSSARPRFRCARALRFRRARAPTPAIRRR